MHYDPVAPQRAQKEAQQQRPMRASRHGDGRFLEPHAVHDAIRRVQRHKVGHKHAAPVEERHVVRAAARVVGGLADEPVGVAVEVRAVARRPPRLLRRLVGRVAVGEARLLPLVQLQREGRLDL